MLLQLFLSTEIGVRAGIIQCSRPNTKIAMSHCLKSFVLDVN